MYDVANIQSNMRRKFHETYCDYVFSLIIIPLCICLQYISKVNCCVCSESSYIVVEYAPENKLA